PPHRNTEGGPMKRVVIILTLILALVSLSACTEQATATPAPQQQIAQQIARGKYLVTIGGCNDCHTPLKMGAKGPEPDFSRELSGHPGDRQLLPPPKLDNSPWFAATAGMT